MRENKAKEKKKTHKPTASHVTVLTEMKELMKWNEKHISSEEEERTEEEPD